LDPFNNITFNYNASRYPLEAVYLTQDFANQTSNFGYNSNLIPNLPALLIDLNVNGQKLIANVDSSILVPAHFDNESTTENVYYVRGDAMNVFVKSSMPAASLHNGNLLGKRRDGGVCTYLDWFNKDGNASIFLQQGLSDLLIKSGVFFDGVFMADNEPYSIVQGEYLPQQPQARALEGEEQPFYDNKWYKTFNSDNQSTYFIPFTPQFEAVGPFDAFAPSLNGTSASSGLKQYDVHSLYGHSMVQATASALKIIKNDTRQFILTKSTFASTGRYSSSYAVTSKYRSWEALSFVIPHVISMNMFGLTHSGTDACGSMEPNGATTAMDEELCLRWLQMTTFMPLARHSQTFTEA